MKKGIIYRATGPTGKVYIGKTIQNFDVRKRMHKNASNNKNSINYDCHFYRALRKYGIDVFVWDILYDNIPIQYLNHMEQWMISMHNSFKCGYNSTLGGEGALGRVVSEKEREMISLRQTGSGNSFYGKTHTSVVVANMRARLSCFVGPKHPQYGKKLSEETKKKISERLSGEKHPLYGKNHTDATKKKISDFRRGTKMSNETKAKISHTMSQKHSGENNPFYGKKHTAETKLKISNMGKGRTHTEEQKIKISESNKRTKREMSLKKAVPFIVIDGEKVIGEWLLSMDCAKDLSLDYSSILKCLKGKQKSHKGLLFKYVIGNKE